MGKKIWMRLGIELDLTDAELEELASGQCSPQRLLELIQSDRCAIIGNSYIPQIEQNKSLAGWEWELPKTPITRFFVNTPDGVLVAHQAGDTDYPAVEVALKADKEGEADITLSLTEYTPGGEGISEFDLTHPDEMRRQQDEVPPERRQMDEDGHEEVTAGFVTRGWPNEAADEEYHHRIFHYGYKGQAK